MKLTLITIISLIYTIQSYSACDLTISSGQDIQASLNQIGINKTLCLNKGNYYPNSTINMLAGQELKGLATDYEVLTLGQLQIKSNADRIIVANDNVTISHLLITRNTTNTLPTYGILSYFDTNVTIWSVKIQNTLIGIGNNHSDGTRILNTFISLNGDLFNNKADPAIWINSSNNVEVFYGEMRGRANGPGGDGEVSSYNSTNVSIFGTNSVDCGASAFYMVNCDFCSIENTIVHRANEWGLDVVSGSDNFYAENNTVKWSNFGGAVFFEFDSIGGTWKNNHFFNNRQMNVGNCDGINVKTNPNNVTLLNNTSTGQVSCSF
jgi:hypothetical protein